MATRKRPAKCADTVALDVLLYEFGPDDRPGAERKIRRRLRDNSLGPYQPERIALLRRLKDEVQGELHRRERSRYYVGSRGGYAALEDFDVGRMVEDWAGSYPEVPREVVAAFIPSAVYLYYMR